MFFDLIPRSSLLMIPVALVVFNIQCEKELENED